MRSRTRIGTVAACVAALLVTAAPLAQAGPNTAPGSADAFYSPNAVIPMSKSPQGLWNYLSTDQVQYTEQSFVFGGPLIEDDGTTNVLALELQRDDHAMGGFLAETVSAGALFNDGSGYRAGGMSGYADVQLPVSMTKYPWSISATQLDPLLQPQFVDARVVKGRIGQKGAVYEFTTRYYNIAKGTPTLQQVDVYVRARDTTGMMQWGYGPSGFAPMWIFPEQRAAIMNDFGGSVGDYLATTKDRMWSQGQYYNTVPMLKVQRFVVQLAGKKVSEGTKGWLWFDNVDRSFTPEANAVVSGGGGIGWTEFSVFIPKSKEAFKIGYTDSSTEVGTYPYAMLVTPNSATLPNGALGAKMRWNIDDIDLVPVKSSAWKSPLTGNSYYLKWHANLDKSKGTKPVHLVITQLVKNQEASIAGRNVFEGVFRVKGTIGSKHVDGLAFGELQQSGNGD